METYTREISRTFGTSASPLIDVNAIDGSIRLRGEDRSDVYLRISARFQAESAAEADALMRRIEDGIEARGSYVRVQAPREHGRGFWPGIRDFLSAWNGALHVDYELVVPRGARVDLRAVNGEVEARNVAGNATVHTVNGAVRLADIGGEVSVRSVNGKLSVERCGGDVLVNLTNGDVDLREVHGRTSLRVLNGSVLIVDAGDEVHARSMSGEMTYRGAVRGDVLLNSAHGAIDCQVPRGARFSVDASSRLGSVTSELPVNENGGSPGERTHVSLRSQTGSIRLRALELEPAGV
jgi:hypothetical protein